MEVNVLESLYWKARIALAKRQFQLALDFINRAIEQNDKRPALFMVRSKVYKRLLQKKQRSQGSCYISKTAQKN